MAGTAIQNCERKIYGTALSCAIRIHLLEAKRLRELCACGSGLHALECSLYVWLQQVPDNQAIDGQPDDDENYRDSGKMAHHSCQSNQRTQRSKPGKNNSHNP